MKKVTLLALAGLLALIFMSAPGFAWGPATHAYITRRLDRRFNQMNIQKMYGGIAPDIFSFVYRVPSRSYFEDQMHKEVTEVLTTADQKELKAFALGFIGHNEVWGADYIALHEPAYISKKADQLLSRILEQNPAQFSGELKNTLKALLALPDGYGDEHAHDLCRIAVEYSVDLLIKRNEDPEIGARIILATTLRDPGIPSLLAKVYGRDQEEMATIIQGETKFRKTMLNYGNDLLQEESAAVKSVAGLIADIAPEALCLADSGHLPAKPKLIAIGIELINGAIGVCRSDYSQSISMTIDTVKKRINTEGNLGNDLSGSDLAGSDLAPVESNTAE